VTVHPALIPRSGDAARIFGLVVLEVEPGSPAELASLLPGDILLGTEEKPFTAIEDLAQSLHGGDPRILRVEFLRGDYSKVRRVAVKLGTPLPVRSPVAA
jgi:S1-C subfamily serine protease